MTKDEARAVGFLAVLLLLAIVARFLNRPGPITIQATPIDVAALRDAGRSLAQQSKKGRSKPQPPALRPTPAYIESAAGPLDINRATAEEIDRLPGVSPAVAERIVARRDSIGRYRSLAQLDSVKGIGPAILEKIRTRVVLK
ncbi:MAG: ComEA family DNA-binding protein [Gemmatimonadota bacterium]